MLRVERERERAKAFFRSFLMSLINHFLIYSCCPVGRKLVTCWPSAMAISPCFVLRGLVAFNTLTVSFNAWCIGSITLQNLCLPGANSLLRHVSSCNWAWATMSSLFSDGLPVGSVLGLMMITDQTIG